MASITQSKRKISPKDVALGGVIISSLIAVTLAATFIVAGIHSLFLSPQLVCPASSPVPDKPRVPIPSSINL